MSVNHPTTNDFLMTLIRHTQGNPAASISMYEIGAAMGLEKGPAGKLAEEVIAEGWAEIKTLAGAIGLTAEGILAGGDPADSSGQRPFSVMGSGPIVQDDDRSEIERLLDSIQACLTHLSIAYPDLEEMVLDLKTARVQLLSHKPKTSILREILRSLEKNSARAGAEDIARRIAAFIESGE